MRLSPRSIAERTVPVSLSSSAVRQRTGVASVSSPSPPPSPLGRGKRSLRFRRSRSPRLVAARDAVFPLPAAIGGSWNSPLRVGRQISDGGTLRVRESCEMHERIKNRSRSGASGNSTTDLFSKSPGQGTRPTMGRESPGCCRPRALTRRFRGFLKQALTQLRLKANQGKSR